MSNIANAMRDMVNRLYAIVIGLSITLLFVASEDNRSLRIACDGWFGLYATAIFWLFLWSEWLWVERFFMRRANIGPLRAVVEFAFCVAGLNVLVACYVLYQRGPDQTSLTPLYDMWQFWFILYLGIVVVSAWLTRRGPFSPLQDYINLAVFAVLLSIWLPDLAKQYGYDKNLANYMLIYFVIAAVIHLSHVVLLEPEGANNAVQQPNIG